ncbi:MAG: VanZ family protein [bacterium]|nr:VanZ family protein [bacterium]
MPEYVILFIKELSGYIEHYGLTAVVIGVTGGVIFVSASILYGYRRGRRAAGKRLFVQGLLIALFLSYLTMLLAITIFSREPGSITAVNLSLFDTFHYKRFTLENVLLFVPFGFLYYFLFHGKWRRVYLAGMTGMLVSVAIEITQYMTSRGGAELDDILTNTAGMLCGYAFAALMRYAWGKEADG